MKAHLYTYARASTNLSKMFLFIKPNKIFQTVSLISTFK